MTPTLKEVKDAAVIQGVPTDQAEQFWLHYEAQGWQRGNGKEVKNWRALLTLWCRDVYGIQAKSLATKARNRPEYSQLKTCPICGQQATSWVQGKCGQCYQKELQA